MLVVGVVLAVMILPIITAVTREVFAQTPRRLQEGALALGATRWEMIRMTVLPFGRSAIISASMLGLGRALGETMAVAIMLSVSGDVTFNLISSANPSTIAANIALDFPESSGVDGQRADRLRPRAVRHDAARQHGRARGHRPQMDPSAHELDDRAAAAIGTPPGPRRRRQLAPARRRCPPWAPAYAVGSPASCCRPPWRSRRRRSRPICAIGSTRCSSSPAIVAASRSTSGRAPSRARARDGPRRHLRHRRLRARADAAGLAALDGRHAGLARFDTDFFTESMRGVIGEGGGAEPRDRRHADHHRRCATLISVPIGIMAAIYLQRVRHRAGCSAR